MTIYILVFADQSDKSLVELKSLPHSCEQPNMSSWVADLFHRSVVTAEASCVRSWLVKMALQFSQNCAIVPAPGQKSWGNLSIQVSLCPQESVLGLPSAPLRMLPPHIFLLPRHIGTYRAGCLPHWGPPLRVRCSWLIIWVGGCEL